MNLFCILSGYSVVFYAAFQISNVLGGSTRLKKRFSKEDICPISEATLEIVSSCPTNNETIQERSLKKNCQKHQFCQGDPLLYHCVRYKNSLAEVCAPKGLITGQCCVKFIEGVGRVAEDYKTPCPECPFHYQSNGSLKYSSCNNLITDLGKPCNRKDKGRDKRSAKCNKNTDELTGKDNLSIRSAENDTILYIAVIAVAVLTFLVGSLLVFMKYRKAIAKDSNGRQTTPKELLLTEKESQGNMITLII